MMATVLTFPGARHEAREKDSIDSARGCIFGLLLSGLMWLGIIAGAIFVWRVW